MCGRYVLDPVTGDRRLDPNAPKVPPPFRFRQQEIRFEATHNAAPTDPMPVFFVGKNGPELTLFRWGLIPSWIREPKRSKPLINARAETAHESPSFRKAFRKRRCLVPMSGFYELAVTPEGRVPYYVHLLNEPVFAAAGLYEWWKNPEGEWVGSYTIITFEPNELVRNAHDRMPAILEPSQYDAWIDPNNGDIEDLRRMLKPYPADEMTAYRVRPLVNNVKNDGPELIEPAER